MNPHASFRLLLACILAFILCPCYGMHAQTPTRVPWVTSKIKGAPESPPPFNTEPAFPALKFGEPIELVTIPGTDRLMLAEHGGKIYTFPNLDQVAKADLFIDMKKVNPGIHEVYSIAFHPGFATNQFIYIWYILKPELPDGTHIARFKMNMGDPPILDPGSEKTIYTWKSGGHNGGSICFGNDGMLYISTGDGEGPSPPDLRNTGQDITDVLGAILRIDVDGEEDGRTYRIPKDNPFINIPGAKPEIWAYGLRNPWRMSVDPVTGDIWTADVGWELWEMVHKVERGANYGWSILEGSKQPVKPDNKRGPTPIVPPIYEHPHSESSSITGGHVYRGTKYPELVGSYIYGDFDTGKIWELRYENKKVTKAREIASTGHKIVSFGLTPENEPLIVDFRGGLHRLVPNQATGRNTDFPTRLSQTGLFSTLDPLTPEKGVIPFSIKAEMWSDYASAERHVGIPETSIIRQERDGKWAFPSNAVLARTLFMEMEKGNSNSLRKIETQLLHFNGERWNPYTYKWDEQEKDAGLVGPSGDEEIITVKDHQAPEGLRQQTWRFNSRAECLRCHNSWLNNVISFTPQYLDRAVSIPGERVGMAQPYYETNQLDLYRSIKLLAASSSRVNPPGEIVNPYARKQAESKLELDKRARSYLHVNCSHCHRENAGGSTTSFMNVEMEMRRAGLIDKDPSQGNFGLKNAKVVTPGDPYGSVLHLRMLKTGAGHMPPLGSRLVDDEGVELVHQWINQLAPSASKPDESNTGFTAELQKLKNANTFEMAVNGPREAMQLARFLAHESNPDQAAKIALPVYQGTSDPVVRDLIERFIPHSQRREVLGNDFDVAKLLRMKGNIENGRALFRNESLGLCVNCHQSEGVGKHFGPDLTAIGKKYKHGELLEQIIQPSKVIDPAFAGHLVEIKDENSFAGLIIQQTDSELLLKDNSGKEIPLKTSEIDKITPMQSSIMPEGLFQSLSAQDAADLLEYLASDK